MWPRVSELVVAAWLVVASFAFAVPGALDATLVPLASGVGVVVAFLASRRWRRAHLGTLVVALVLIGWGWARFPRPGPAAAQNAILSGLMLGLFAIVPNEAMDPPVAWRPHARDGE